MGYPRWWRPGRQQRCSRTGSRSWSTARRGQSKSCPGRNECETPLVQDGGMSGAAEVTIRYAREADLEAIQRIYNHEVATGTATWDEEPWPMEKRRTWFAEHDALCPLLVAEAGGRVVGFASLSKMSQKSGWRFTREDTIYLDPAWRGCGLGRRLLGELLQEAWRIGMHAVVATISSENSASIELHRSLGFEVVGTLRETGLKFGRRLSTTYMQLVRAEE
ncbi:MAG: N-acetyltransferase family protein [Chloroflexi bacterium CFX7]|nr:N-acetyltransferase family protein [Chloroflexi bacterium CFX7]RIL01595.1 MAG: GNAT family N-acetyltransferase [bacterium]